MNFWDKLKKPILCLAPMADVTDRAFRSIIAKYGKPDVLWTEFVSADGLFGGGYEALINDLSYTPEERPIVAQFFTSKPEAMEKAVRLAAELGFDGVDINMGCPDKSVEKQGAGAKLMKDPKLAREIIAAAKEGAKNKIPVSIKTRLGYNKDELESWLPEILAENPAAIILHARTRKEMSKVPARWERIKRAVEIRDESFAKSTKRCSLPIKTLIIGNGDVSGIEDAIKKCEESGADGAMIGRGIFGNPWLFAGKIPTVEEKLKVLVEHSKLFEKLVAPKPPLGQAKSFAVMKKHFKAYVSGWEGAKELRMKLMEAEDAGGVEKIVKNFLSLYN